MQNGFLLRNYPYLFKNSCDDCLSNMTNILPSIMLEGVNALCMLFKTIAYEINGQIQNSMDINYQLKEEGLTDFLALSLHNKRILKSIKYCENMYNFFPYYFNRNEEKESGADYAIWFWGYDNQVIGIRFQAKILKYAGKTSHNIEGFNHNNGNQINNLINEANDVNAIPLYNIYLSNKSLTPFHGCSMIHAEQFKKDINQGEIVLSKLIQRNLLTPWHKLLCPARLFQNSTASSQQLPSLASIIFSNLENFYGDFIHDNYIMLSENLPSYVKQIINTSNSKEYINIDNPSNLDFVLVIKQNEFNF